MSNITLTIPNDDHVALRAFGKALEEMALAHGAEPRKPIIGEMQQDDYKQWYDEALEASNEAGYSCMSVADVIRNMHGYMKTLEQYGSLMHSKAEVDTTAQQPMSLAPFKVGDVTLAVDEESGDLEPVADSTGTPWDERIHSTSKALNADGTWRLRRKPKDMDEAQWVKYVEAVKTDMTDANDDSWDTDRRPGSGGNGGVGIGESDDIEPPVTPPGDDFHTDAGVVTEQTVAGIPPLPVPQLGGSSSHSSQSTPYKLVGSGDDLSSGSGTGIPPLPVPPPVVVAPPVPEVTTWDFPHLMTFLTERHGKIDVATVNTLLAQDGMSSVQELNAHPDKIGPFVARVKAHLGE